VKYSISLALFAASALFAAPAPVFSDQDVPLVQVASQLGYAYAYLGVEDAVQLSRPGLVILIRPGERLIDVNDRTETIEVSPRFSRDDLYVSDSFVERLRRLAEKYPAAVSHIEGRVPIISPDRMQQAGTITLDVRQLAGRQSLSVSGKAPASAPITLTLRETFWTELPDVVLSRTEVEADSVGNFEATVPVAPGYMRGGILTLTASSYPRITTASAQLVLKAPNDGVDIPAQQEPKGMR
jgi:Copper amine oxidase N-terminal domain